MAQDETKIGQMSNSIALWEKTGQPPVFTGAMNSTLGLENEHRRPLMREYKFLETKEP